MDLQAHQGIGRTGHGPRHPQVLPEQPSALWCAAKSRHAKDSVTSAGTLQREGNRALTQMFTKKSREESTVKAIPRSQSAFSKAQGTLLPANAAVLLSQSAALQQLANHSKAEVAPPLPPTQDKSRRYNDHSCEVFILVFYLLSVMV